MPGHIKGAEVDPGDRDRLAATDQVLGLIRSRREAAQVVGVAARHPHLGRRRLGQILDGADVVEVPVGDQDRGRRPATLPERLQHQLGRITGVDDDRLP